MSDTVTFEAAEEVSTITLDDGEANVLSIETVASLNDALDRAADRSAPVVIAGRPGMFSGGFDLETFEAGGAALVEMLTAGAETVERLLDFPRPVVMACTGHAIAMGLFTMLTGDERIGAAGDFTLQANEVEIGLTLPRYGVELCRQRVRSDHLGQVTLLAEPYTPEDAAAAGILNDVVPADEVIDRAHERARTLARLDLEAYTATKDLLREDATARLREAIETDVEGWESAFG